MIIDSLSKLPDLDGGDCVVVVGAGAVGTHLAVQIARRGQRVVLLESGNRVLASFPHNAYRSTGRKHQGIHLGRSVALGGTTNLWGGQLVEFEPYDFEERDWVPQSNWPIDYEELARFYGLTYEALGYRGELQNDAAVWKAIGRTSPVISDEIDVFLTRWLQTPNFARLYQDDLETNPNLFVVMNTTVVGLHGHDSQVDHLSVVDHSGKSHNLKGRKFVLAAGTIENARLLLHAASERSWKCPWRENENIGRYFHDHLGGPIARVLAKDRKKFFGLFSTIVTKGGKFLPKVRPSETATRSNRMLGVQAMLSFEHSIKEHLVFLKQFLKAALGGRKIGSVWQFCKHALASARYLPPLMWAYVVQHRLIIPRGAEISLIVQAEVEPLWESRVSIDSEHRDRFGLPVAVLDWHLSGRELESLAQFAEMMKRSLEASGLGTLEIAPLLAQRKAEFLDTLHDTNHQGGGCIMGNSAEDGVVDHNLRIFGCDNVYVVGASVFRTASHANCTFTGLAFATRLAEHLTERAT